MSRADRYTARTAVVTGGGRGIGRAIATGLAAKGMRVVIGDIDAEVAEQAAAEIGRGTTAHHLDVTSEDSYLAFLDAVEAEAPVDVLVNNAGIMPTGPFLEETRESTRRQVEINIFGVVNGCRLVLPRFVSRGHGHLVNVSSVAGRGGYAGIASYSGTKFYVYGFSEALRTELKGTGVDISVVMPGFVDTELTAGIGSARFFKLISPEDVAGGVVDAIGQPRFDVFVPKVLGPMGVGMSMLPRRARDIALKFARADKLALSADHAQRAEYELRAARSAPEVLEAREPVPQLTDTAG